MNRKTLIIGLLVLALAALAGATVFDEYGVWKAASSASLLAGRTAIYGPVSIYDRATVLNIGVYGSTTGDSLKFTVQLYGGFSYTLGDSVKFKLLKTTGIVRQVNTSKTYSVSDTIDAESGYPYVFIKFTNNHADSTVTYDLSVYGRESDKTILRLK